MKAAVRLHVYLLLAVTFFACAKPSLAQEQPNVSNFIDPASAYHTNDFDSVDVFNQRLGITVPLHADHSQRGNLNFTYSLQYAATTQWYTAVYYDAYGNPYYYWQPATGTINSPHFSMDGDLLIGANTYGECGNPNTGGWCVANYAGDESGAMHYLGTTSESPYAGETVDGSGIRFDGSALINRQGVRFQQINPSYAGSPSSIEDANGNLLTFSCDDTYADCTAYSYDRYMTDTLGRVWAYRVHSSDVSTCPGGTVNADILDIPGFNGSTSVYKLCYNWVTVSTSFGLSCCAEFSGPQLLATSLILPDGSTWQFQYDLYGDLTNVTLPTGGTVTYNWTTNASYERILTSRIRWDGTNTTEWDYNGTTVTADATGAHNDTVYTAVNPTYPYCDNRISQVQTYQGPASGGNLLQTLSYSYQVLDNPFLSDIGSCGVSALQTGTTTTLGTEVTQKAESYDLSWSLGLSFTDDNWGSAYTSSYGLQVVESDFDWGSGAPGNVIARKITDYASFYYPSYLSANILDLPVNESVTDGNWNQCGVTQYGYDAASQIISSGISMQHTSAPVPGVSGNLTAVYKWVSQTPCQPGATGSWITQLQNVFDTGMVAATSDFVPHTAVTYSYGGFGAYPGTVCNALSQCTNFAYDWNTGLITSSTDPNNQTTSYTYDIMFRPTQINYPDGGWTSWSYVSPTEVQQTQAITNSMNKVTTFLFDGLGRSTQTQLNSDPEGVVYSETAYDALGRIAWATNPHRSTGNSTDGVTFYSYDALGRVTTVTDQDGSVASTSYFGNWGMSCASKDDEAGKWHTFCYDGLGRLVWVWEDPPGLSLFTSYYHDSLGNLLSVNQSGQTRTFTYDSLSQLLSATNPESGTTIYTYDNNGNILTRTRPAPNQRGSATVTTSYYYDALNRPTQTSYSDGTTPTAQFYYDASMNWSNPSAPQTNVIGRLSAAYSVQTGEVFGYDPMGRVLVNNQCTPYNCGSSNFPVNYAYDFLGDMTQYTNGVGVVFNQTFDGAGRATSVTSSINDAQHPPTLAGVPAGVGYYPPGQLQAMTLGNGLTESIVVDPRLQPCVIDVNASSTLMTQCNNSEPTANVQNFGYAFNYGTANNGNITEWWGSGIQNFARLYSYDGVNRLSTMSASGDPSGCTGLSWSYDTWGNRTAQSVTGGTCNAWSQSYTGNNQISGFQYDAAGNVTNDSVHSYTYDAENRVVAVDGGSAATYVYDAEGRRVRSNVVGNFDYVYDLHGDVVTQWDSYVNGVETWGPGYVYFNGQLLAEYANGTTYFAHNDHLGSTRLLTDMNQSVAWCKDYLPFGEQLSYSGCTDTGITNHDFTGKERDSESGLDNFGTRYFGSGMGRFLSPDPSGISLANLADPQQLNLYSYVRNNPLSNVDPDGHDCITTNQWNNEGTLMVSIYSGVDCTGISGGTYINGTVDPSSLTYNSQSNTLGFSFSNSAEETGGAGILTLGTPPLPDPIGTLAADINQDNPGGFINGSMLMMATNAVAEGLGRLIGLGVEAFQGAKAGAVAMGGADAATIAARATSTVGNQSIVASSREAALAAAEEFVGPGARAITDRSTGEVVGKISADGTKVYRTTSPDYVNLENKTSGGNLHVRF